MLEVVFSDSAAGTMAVAIGHKGFLGGATSVIISDGTVSKEEIEKAIEGIGKSVSVRGEALTLEEFAALSNLLCESERMRTKE